MKLYRFLRLYRVIFAITAVIIISMMFFDIYNLIPASTARQIVLLQFIPSLLGFIHSRSILFIFFLFILMITFIAGRSYCSFLCPLGIFQDSVLRIASLFNPGKKFYYLPALNVIRYTILSAVIISFAAGGTILIMIFDPFSLYGRFASVILSPAVTGINNTAASVLLKFNIYSLHPVDIRFSSILTLIFTVTVTLLIAVIAVLKGRLYCNTICPVGSLLGLASKFSLLQIRIDAESCIHCGKCEKICKSSCIRHADEHVDFSSCVSCFNCLTACPNSSIKISRRPVIKSAGSDRIREKKKPDSGPRKFKISRRSFIAGTLLLPAAMPDKNPAKNRVLYYQDGSKQKQYKKSVFTSPPGSAGISRFNERCTACSLCITRCPSSVLQPAVMQYGIHGIMQPFMDFSSGYCNYDCVICSETCPSGAIEKISIADKHLIQGGKSYFIKENCITYTNGTACGACSEHCPTKAVNMVPYKKDLVIPEVNQKICTGCGACEFVCPVRPFKAIYVEGNRLHQKAELPAKEKKITVDKGDFPF